MKQAKTDWDSYYQRPYRSATLTRKITGHYLVKLIKKYYLRKDERISLAELGGGNSCFFNLLNDSFHPQQYTIVDNNKIGIDKFIERLGTPPNARALLADVLNYQEKNEVFDIVYSVGLIEHFSLSDTRKAIQTHFDLIRPDGFVIITYPTPTYLYQIVRKISEFFNLWIFHDERPLTKEEVVDHIHECEKKYQNNFSLKIEKHFINWAIFLTQGIIVVRKIKRQ